MSFRLATDTRNKACDAIVDDLDTGGGAGKILIFTGAQPTNVDDADPAGLVGTINLAATAFGSASAGVAVMAGVPLSATAVASGTAACFRFKDFANAIHSDGTCGLGSGDLSFNNNVIVSGGTITILSFTVTV